MKIYKELTLNKLCISNNNILVKQQMILQLLFPVIQIYKKLIQVEMIFKVKDIIKIATALQVMV